ncbi:oxidative DNA demethylase [Rhizoclosmatium sp. JEL0117]|nr:oxidative DNA demethylase [Rhizoclosmatium sp. JEL0117]
MATTFAHIQGAAPSAEDAHLTRTEFRQSFFDKLRGSGIEGKLKAQLRQSLVSELRRHAALPTSSPSSLLARTIDSLIADYLKRRGSEFTLSVFLPESNLNSADAILGEVDVLRVLHVDVGTATLVKEFRNRVEAYPPDAPTIVKLLESVSQVLDISVLEKECQTNMDDVEILDSELRRIHNSINPLTAHRLNETLEQRIHAFQQSLELRLSNDKEQEIRQFKELELAKIRVEERARYQSEISVLRADFERRLVEERGKQGENEEAMRKWVSEREKELERGNIELRQKVLEEQNRVTLTDQKVRAEMESRLRSFELENDRLKKSCQEYEGLAKEYEREREREREREQEIRAGMERDHAEAVASVRVEKAKIDAEKAILSERTKILQRQLQEVNEAQTEMQDLRDQVKSLRNLLRDAQRERDDALFLTRDLKLQVNSQTTGSALEFEIHSLKTQLLEAEQISARRQDEYQNLLKSFMAPQNELQKEVNKLRKSESRWQRECQDLVAKLDLELNRNEELQQKLEEEILKNKELKRDISEFKLLLHRIQTTQEGLVIGDTLKSYSRMDIIPNPLDLLSRPVSPYRNLDRYIPPQLPVHRPGQDSPPRGMSLPRQQQQQPEVKTETLYASPKHFTDAWDQGTRKIEGVAYRAGLGALGFFDEGERQTDGAGMGSVLPDVSGVVGKSFYDEVLESLSEEKSVDGVEVKPKQETVTNEGGSAPSKPVNTPAAPTPKPQDLKLEQPSQPESVKSHKLQARDEPPPFTALKTAQSVEEIRKSLAETIQSIREESNPVVAAEVKAPEQAQPIQKKPTFQELLKQEKEEEERQLAERRRAQEAAEYERRRQDRERRDQELEELERKSTAVQADALEESRREKEKARLAGIRARDAEQSRRSAVNRSSGSLFQKKAESESESSKSTSSGSGSLGGGPGNKSEDTELKILNDFEADPLMQKYLAIVKEKREKEQAVGSSAAAQDEKASKILSALENTSLISTDESNGKILSGETMDDISAPSSSEDVLDDPW